jgi:hypothetical protein
MLAVSGNYLFNHAGSTLARNRLSIDHLEDLGLITRRYFHHRHESRRTASSFWFGLGVLDEMWRNMHWWAA